MIIREKMKKYTILLLPLLLLTLYSNSQEVVDKVIATVGNKIILKSEVENQYIQLLSQGKYLDEGDLKCDIFEEMMFQKLLLIQAEIDSVEVTEKEINNEMDRRLSVFISQLGSEKKLEEYLGKSISDIKDDFKELIREQILAQRVQASLTEKVKVTPSDVKKVFDEIPEDSLPIIDAYVELSEIVINPKIGKAEKDETIKKLSEIRDRILAGESFSTMAVLYSEDPGSAANGGELGFVSRTDLVPEFASVGFALKNTTDISRVVETDFGFHIIQLIEKRGNMMNFRHILLTPRVSVEQIEISERRADSIYQMLKNDSISFENAITKYSDGDSKFNWGKISNPYTGTTKLSDDALDNNIKRSIYDLKTGEISKPFLTTTNSGAKIFKIIKVNNRVDKHLANLNDDYQEIQEFATQKENQKVIENWIKSKVKTTFINIDKSYQSCNFKFADWTAEK